MPVILGIAIISVSLKVEPVPPGFSPRGCKGRSPLHKKTKNLPLPAGKSALRARVRGMGAGKHAKGKVDRRQKGKPPTVTTPYPLTPLFEKSSEGFGGLFQESPGVSPPPFRTGKSKENQPDQVAARISEKALDKCPKVWYNTTCYGGIAQLVRAPR